MKCGNIREMDIKHGFHDTIGYKPNHKSKLDRASTKRENG
jgi:hypothetical protein